MQAELACAAQETDNPDLRGRAYVYWRLLGDPKSGCAPLAPCALRLEAALSWAELSWTALCRRQTTQT